MESDLIDTMLRMGAAVAVGILVGTNRDLAGKPIGMRTLGLVSLGSAVVALATIRLDLFAGHPDAMSRVVQGVIQGIMGGIGFIGAGVILRDHQSETIKGLTTAATVWVTAALGIACALAAWTIVAVAVMLTLATLVGVGWAESLRGTSTASSKTEAKKET
jgi:putative Mg2+ transporter-C (MgtC) family protein